MYNNDSVLSIKDASGRHVSLLNENATIPHSSTTFKIHSLMPSLNPTTITSKRKYHCTEPGCNKSFTTSGHLARHNRIHTGEKNFHCLHPGCPSRFSRQDNMMQHYRTHLSQKARRQQQQLKKAVQKTSVYCHPQENSRRPTTRPRRSTTMPSLPYPMFDTNQDRPIVRPRRALSTSSTCSSATSSSFISSPYSSPQFNHILPPPTATFHSYPPTPYPQYPHHYQRQTVEPNKFTLPQPAHWDSKPSEKSLSSLLHLANIVSTFG